MLSNGRSSANIQRAPCGASVIRGRIVLLVNRCLVPRSREEIDTGTYGARHSMPSQCHMTTPRQYIEPGGVAVLPGNSARKAISEEFASAAMLPGESRSENPEIGRASCRERVEISGVAGGVKKE